MKYKIQTDAAELRDRVTLDEFIEMQEGNLKVIKSVLAMFVVDESGNKVEEVGAAKWLGSLTLNQIDQAGADFVAAIEGAAVPKEKE